MEQDPPESPRPDAGVVNERLERVRRGLAENEAERAQLLNADTSELLPDVPETQGSRAAPPPRARVLAGLGQHEDAREALPESLGPFSLIRELGRGGAGVVYVARHARLEREVALKVLRAGDGASPEQLERFEIEARAAARLRHPGIVGVLEVGEEAGKPYLAMELIEGESLAQRLAREGPLEPREAARIALGLAEALAYAHARLVLHRDLKPGNVLLGPDGAPRLTDFGLAKQIGAESQGLTVTGQVMGTPVYMPPEQASGRMERVDARSDVYSLGATLYEMLSGRPPYLGQQILEVLAQVRADASVPDVRGLRPEVEVDLATILGRTLEKDPDDRYQTAEALAQDLARYLAHQSIAARPPGVLERGQKWLRRNRTLARALGGTLAAALGVGAVATGAFVLRLQAEQARTAEQAEVAQTQAQRADAQAAEAERQAEHARRQAAVAQEALRLMIYEVRDQLERVPGPRAQAAREAILAQALSTLEELGAAASEAGSLIQRAEAKRQLGELRLEGVGGDRQRGYQDLRDALALSREARAAVPDDPTTRQDLIKSLYVLGGALPASEPEAQTLLEEALAESERLVQGDGAQVEEVLRLAWRRHLALALERLAGVHSAAGRDGQALELYLRALAERQGIAEVEDNPREERPLAILRRFAGYTLTRLGRYAEALAHHDASVAFMVRVVDRDPSSQHRFHLAESYQQRGHTREAVRDDEGARADYTQALNLIRALRAEDPLDRALLRSAADSLAALARLAHDPAQEEAHYQEALRLTGEVYATHPDLPGLRADLVGLCLGYGRFLGRRGETYQGLELLERGLELARRALAAAPGSWSARWQLSELLHAVGQSRLVARDLPAAREALEEAVALRRKQTAEAAADAPIQRELASSLMLLGQLALLEGKLPAAQASLDESQRILEGLLVRAPENALLRGTLAEALQRQAQVAEALGDEDGAAAALERALRADEPDPDDPLQVRARIDLLHRLANERLAANGHAPTPQQLAEAERLVGEATERSRALAERPAAERHDRRLAGRSEALAGEVALRGGDPDAAIPRFEQAASRLRAMVHERPSDREARRDLALCLERIGEAHFARGRVPQALSVYRECLEERRALLAADPGSLTYRHDLGVVLAGVMNCHVRFGDLEGALQVAREGVESHRILVRQAPRYQAELETFEGAVRQLEAQLQGDAAPAGASPRERLRAGAALLREGRPLEAVAAFRDALAEREIALDLREKALYNAACAAALAAQASEGAARGALFEEAWTWLADDLERHGRLLARVEAKLAEEGLPPDHARELTGMQRFCTAHFDHARQDPDLEPLRAADAERFARLFPR
ncbi:MAG: serine/threonine-protein kinase [Planctomycetota bacterium]